eukprot:jgi/Mesvir1/19042/Mv12804-RA.1
MDSVEMSEYERRRAENVARNAAMMAGIGLEEEAAKFKPPAHGVKRQTKGLPASERKKLKAAEEPVPIRRSLRSRGVAPDSTLAMGIAEEKANGSVVLAGGGSYGSASVSREPDDEPIMGTVPMKSTNAEEGSVKGLCQGLRTLGQEVFVRDQGKVPDFHKVRLAPDDVAKVVKDRIYSIVTLPVVNMLVVAAGDKNGQLALWDVDQVVAGERSGTDGVYTFQPHTRPITGFAFPGNDPTKMYTTSYDGSLRCMDVAEEAFHEVLRSTDGESFTSLCPGSLEGNAASCLFVGDDFGALHLVDPRAGEPVVGTYDLEQKKINTVEVSPLDWYILATASTSGNVSLWDVRALAGAKHGKSTTPVGTYSHPVSSHGALFSPSGRRIVSTSTDNTVAILSVAKLWHAGGGVSKRSAGGKAVGGKGAGKGGTATAVEEVEEPHRSIAHNNHTGRWITPFRAVWADWEDHVLVGNMGKGMDVLSADKGRVVVTYRSEFMSAIPSRIACYSGKPGIFVGGTASGRAHVWR